MPEPLAAIEIETGKNPTASIIWLHGLGADGNDFAAIVPELRLPKTAIRFPPSLGSGKWERAAFIESGLAL